MVTFLVAGISVSRNGLRLRRGQGQPEPILGLTVLTRVPQL